MQLDMHYYGTYAMARAAGITPEAAGVIATSAQFVDDNVAGNAIEFDDGSRIDTEATAHHPVTMANLQSMDQRQVWVPFHFLPGNIGNDYRNKLKCRKDSELAKKMIQHHIGCGDRRFACELMGIGAHVYADTFSHYGFSGVSSRGNFVQDGSIHFEGLGKKIEGYILAKARKFFSEEKSQKLDNIRLSGHAQSFAHKLVTKLPMWLVRVINRLRTGVVERISGALGHGTVATYPDRPYLKWKFQYDEDDAEAEDRWSHRDNPKTFLQGCQALHRVFMQFAQAHKDYDAGDGRDFGDIENAVKKILATQADKAGRIQAWKDAAQSGAIFGAQGGESIPDYDGASWNEEWKSFDGKESYLPVLKSSIWRFYQAAAIHRVFVLRDLLPAHDLVVD